MKFPGKLEAGLQSGVLTEAKYIKGTYIVFTTTTERNKFSECGCKEVLVKGAKCYVASEKQEYRWDGIKWIPLQTDIPVAPVDGKIYGLQNGQWVEVNVAGLDATIEEITNNITGIENSITDLQNRVENNTNMVNYLNAQFLNKADKSDIPTKVSQLENDSGFITLTVAENKFATTEEFNDLKDEIDGINNELSQIQDSITDLGKDVVKYTTFTSPETITITTTNGKSGNSVDIDDPTTPTLPTPDSETKVVQVTRKTIQLDNYDSISGLDTGGEGHNLAMVSKWNIADFGSPGLHLNLNTKDNVTINDTLVVLTTDDKTDLENEIQQAIADAEHIHFEIVDSLPEVGDSNAIYLIANGDFYNEYIYVDGKWDSIGTTADVDLGNYYTKAETRNLINSSLNNYPTEAQVNLKIINATSNLVTQEDLATTDTNLRNLTLVVGNKPSQEYVDQSINSVKQDLDNYVQLSLFNSTLENYTTSQDVDNKINNKINGLASEEYVNTSIEDALTPINNSIASINESITDVNTNVSNLTSIVEDKQDILVSGTNIKTINGQSILGSGDIQISGNGGNSSYTLPVATTATLGGIKSGNYESEEGMTIAVVVDGEGNASVRVPDLSQLADQQDVVNLLNSGVNKVVISGGSASD